MSVVLPTLKGCVWLAQLIFVCSLPKDQDCHELWCKRRKRSMREAAKQGQDVSSLKQATSAGQSSSSQPGSGGATSNKAERRSAGLVEKDGRPPEPASAPPSSSSSSHKSSVGILGVAPTTNITTTSTTTSSATYKEVIPGLDFPHSAAAQEEVERKVLQPPEPAELLPIIPKQYRPPEPPEPEECGIGADHDQSQLAGLVKLLQAKQGGMNAVQLSQVLNIPLDGTTKQLLENLSMQLVLGGSSQRSQSVTPQFYNEDSCDSLGGFGGYRGGYGGSDSRMEREGRGSDSGAGVKVALAQLLRSQGLSVTIGGVTSGSSQTNRPNQSIFSSNNQPSLPHMHAAGFPRGAESVHQPMGDVDYRELTNRGRPHSGGMRHPGDQGQDYGDRYRDTARYGRGDVPKVPNTDLMPLQMKVQNYLDNYSDGPGGTHNTPNRQHGDRSPQLRGIRKNIERPPY